MFVLAVRYDMHLGGCHSLKEKRGVLRPVIDRLRNHGCSTSEIDHHDSWQLASIGIAIVAPTPGRAEELADEADRVVWGRPDLEVTSSERRWLEWE